MKTYQTNDAIVLTFRAIKNGTPQAGETVTCRVINPDTGAVVLASGSMTHNATTTGLYTRTWSSPPTTRGHYLAIYTWLGSEFDEEIYIDDTHDKMDDADGRAIV